MAWKKLIKIKGEDGKTPLEGVDFVVPNEDEIIDKILELIPEPKEINEKEVVDKVVNLIPKQEKISKEDIVKDVVKLIPKPKDGKDGKNASSDSIIEQIKKLKGKKRIPLSSITDSEYLMKLGSNNSKKIDTSDQRWHGGGATNFLALKDTPSSYSGEAAKTVIVNATEDGLEFGLASSSDEKVKISATDTTTGYLDDKLTVTAPIFKTTNNPAGNENIGLSIPQADTSTDGYLSSADWDTFNDKFDLPALTAGSVLFSDGSTIAQDNANLFWDDTNNRLGIGTDSPDTALHVVGSIKGVSNGTKFEFYEDDVAEADAYFKVTNGTSASGIFTPLFWTKGNSANHSGAWFIGDTKSGTDTGTIPIVRFDARSNNTTVSTRPTFTFRNSGTVQLQLEANGDMGLGTITPNARLDIKAGTNGGAGNILLGQDSLGTTQFTVTDQGIFTIGDGSLLATSAAPTTDAMIANKKYVDDLDALQVNKSEWLQNGFVDDSAVTLTWTDSTPDRTLTVTPTSGSYDYYIQGIKYTESGSLTEQIADEDGLFVIYFDSEGVLTSVKNPTHNEVDAVIENKCIVAYVYYNTTTLNDGRLMNEKHGYRMNPATHEWIHDNVGAVYKEGMALADFDIDQDGNTTTDAQFSIASGEFYDEDVEHELSAVTSTTGIEIWYLNGSVWNWETRAGYSFLMDGGDVQWNDSGTQADVGGNDFCLIHVFATNITADDGTSPKYIAIQGQAEYTNRRDARAGADTEINTLVYGTLPLEEIIPVATIIVQNRGTYGALRTTDSGDNYVDWRSSNLKASGGSIADHGSLAGLTDDDHEQYALLLGRSGGQTLIGGIDAGDDLTLQSTSNATKGSILFGTSAYDEVNNFLGIGLTDPDEQLELTGRIHLGQTTAPGVTTDKLYNVGGTLYWNGSDLTAGGGMSDPMTTRGDMIFKNSSNVTARLPIGGASTFLSSDGTDVSWSTIPQSDMSTATFYDETGGVALTTSYATVNIDATETNNDGTAYTLASDQITIGTTGYYSISYNVGAAQSGGTRGSTDVKLQVNTGGGFADITSSLVSGYWRTASGNGNDTSKTINLSLDSGDIVQMQAKESGEGATTVVNRSTISFVLLSGAQGPTGATGPAGDTGISGTPVDNQIAVWTDATTIEGTTGLTYNGSNLQLTGDIGSTGSRITKAWFTDLQVTNAIAGSITGNAATVSTITGLAPDTATTQATQPNITTTANLTTVGTIGTGIWEATDIGVAHGGTGKSSWTQYLIPYADTTTSFSQIPIGTDGQVLTSNGAGSAPSFQDAGGGGGQTTYDAVVASSGGDYTTLGAAITGGATSIFVEDGTYNETGNIAMPSNLYVKGESRLGVNVNMATYIFTDGANSNFTFENLSITFASTTFNVALFDSIDGLTLNGIYIDNNSTNSSNNSIAATASDGSNVLKDVEIDMPNISSSGVALTGGSNRHTIDGLKIIGGGSSSSNVLFIDGNVVADNINLTGTFSTSVDVIFMGATVGGSILNNLTLDVSGNIQLEIEDDSIINNLYAKGTGSETVSISLEGATLNNVTSVDCDLDVALGGSNGGALSNYKGSGDISFTSDDNRATNITTTGNITIAAAGDNNTISNSSTIGSVSVSGDQNVLVGMRVGALAGGGSNTITVVAGATNNTVTSSLTDAAISDSGTSSTLTGNAVY